MRRDEIELRAVPDVAEAPRVVADGPLSFVAFYGEHFDRMHTALVLVTGNRHEAEEIAQESFLRVFERWNHISVLESPVGYVYRTAMNVFRNRHRRASLALRRAFALAPSATDDLGQVESRDELLRLLRDLAPRAMCPRPTPPRVILREQPGDISV